MSVAVLFSERNHRHCGALFFCPNSDELRPMKEVRQPQETFSSTVRIVLPNDTNTLGNLMGGNLLHWMDVAAAVSANRHCRRVVVTAAVNNVSFDRPIRLGDVVIIESQVTRAFNSSMEVYLEVFVENATTGARSRCNEAYYTFVAVDQLGGPIAVPAIEPQNEQERGRFDSALRRRQLRLILAGKLKPEEATELRALFS